jgi:hypothetical protein
VIVDEAGRDIHQIHVDRCRICTCEIRSQNYPAHPVLLSIARVDEITGDNGDRQRLQYGKLLGMDRESDCQNGKQKSRPQCKKDLPPPSASAELVFAGVREHALVIFAV